MNCVVEAIVDRIYAVVEYTRTCLWMWSYEPTTKGAIYSSGDSAFRPYYGSANRSRFYTPPVNDWVIEVREDKCEDESWKN